MKQINKIIPELYITQKVYNKMSYLISTCNKEVGWHGFVKRNGMQFIWYDIILYPQYVTGTTVNPEDDEYVAWQLQQFTRDNFDDMKLHGHSHVNMGTTPSGVDMTFREDLIRNLKEDSFYIFLINNKKGDLNIEIYDKVSNTIYETKDISVYIGLPEDINDTTDWTNKVLKEYVKEKVLCTTTSKAWNSSIQKSSSKKSMSSESVQSEDPYARFYQDWDWMK